MKARVGAVAVHYAEHGAGRPVLVLHGTAGSGASMLTPAFAGELFGPGQPLDATKYFIIIPDSIGHGRTSKPSDGLRAAFPLYLLALGLVLACALALWWAGFVRPRP